MIIFKLALDDDDDSVIGRISLDERIKISVYVSLEMDVIVNVVNFQGLREEGKAIDLNDGMQLRQSFIILLAMMTSQFYSMATFEVLDELMEITGSTELHKRMRCWFVQEIAEEEGLLKFLRDRCDDLRRKSVRRRVLIREMKA
ncbi:hypothetical protein Tco_1014657 [Tanacetum coccineum]